MNKNRECVLGFLTVLFCNDWWWDFI